MANFKLSKDDVDLVGLLAVAIPAGIGVINGICEFIAHLKEKPKHDAEVKMVLEQYEIFESQKRNLLLQSKLEEYELLTKFIKRMEGAE